MKKPRLNNVITDESQRRLLGQFVRSHRERMRPEAPSGRRRTPGLRREELAVRAGISTIWCAWIEQGRDIQASANALCRLADALGLSSQDRAALFHLAGRIDPKVEVVAPAAAVPASLLSVVRGLEHPTYALDRQWNACCWNNSAAKLFPGWLGAGRERNLLHYLFLSRSVRRLIPQWRDWALRQLEEFRHDNQSRLGDPVIQFMLEKLCENSDLFSKAWNEPRKMTPATDVTPALKMSDGSSYIELRSLYARNQGSSRIISLWRITEE